MGASWFSLSDKLHYFFSRIFVDGISKRMQVISGHLGWVRSIAFDPGNEWFCTGSADRTIKVSPTACIPILEFGN